MRGNESAPESALAFSRIRTSKIAPTRYKFFCFPHCKKTSYELNFRVPEDVRGNESAPESAPAFSRIRTSNSGGGFCGCAAGRFAGWCDLLNGNHKQGSIRAMYARATASSASLPDQHRRFGFVTHVPNYGSTNVTLGFLR